MLLQFPSILQMLTFFEKGIYLIHIRPCDQAIYQSVEFTSSKQDVGAGTRLSQHHDMQLHKKICSCTDFTICTVLN